MLDERERGVKGRGGLNEKLISASDGHDGRKNREWTDGRGTGGGGSDPATGQMWAFPLSSLPPSLVSILIWSLSLLPLLMTLKGHPTDSRERSRPASFTVKVQRRRRTNE